MSKDDYYTFRVKAIHPNGDLQVDYWPRIVKTKEDIKKNIDLIKLCFNDDVKLEITYKQGYNV